MRKLACACPFAKGIRKATARIPSQRIFLPTTKGIQERQKIQEIQGIEGIQGILSLFFFFIKKKKIKCFWENYNLEGKKNFKFY